MFGFQHFQAVDKRQEKVPRFAAYFKFLMPFRGVNAAVALDPQLYVDIFPFFFFIIFSLFR